MRLLGVLLLLAAVAYSDDAKPNLKVNTPTATVTWDQWAEFENDIRGSSMTTVNMVRALREHAALVVVEQRCKILNIFPNARPPGSVTVSLVHLFGGVELHSFLVTKAQRPQVKDWKKWDPVTVRSRIGVTDLGVTSFLPIYKGPESLRAYPKTFAARKVIQAQANWSMAR